MSAHPKQWLAIEDQALRSAYAAGLTWDEIAARLHVSRFAAIARGQRLAIIRKQPAPKPKPMLPPPRRDLGGRQCFPPGHAVTWLAIVAGTLLEGVPFPG